MKERETEKRKGKIMDKIIENWLRRQTFMQ